ncbi:hypothetical protein COM13_12480 [Bacillus pseudomycoides]|uniref:hypothetical protein n=1 Tax=Bacillus pseudomycoides TaxID=64104 RepID=UPI0001A13612|nr:hypothetical protein [Bacillus pseudomycoides]EEM07471.1 hypothetical protein bmyco0003_58660 [Bacillus pseudomycoides]MBD5799353.1 hypothetical protein [Bacillus pseudomycoides]PDZ12281.1 hypothetical protein CON70_07125 [Bacillus pseudomycoides]PEE04591.1 hypothetical protein CON86_19360 [Bacillus pseudomycoides]PEJ40007.1 hypothetical protein CN677_01745 [Bacillus pseudomycoides]
MQYVEMLKELAIGGIYTEKQISNLLCNNRKELTILCDSVSKFGESETERFQVMGKYEIYVHRNKGYSYHVPSRKTMVYVIEKI